MVALMLLESQKVLRMDLSSRSNSDNVISFLDIH